MKIREKSNEHAGGQMTPANTNTGHEFLSGVSRALPYAVILYYYKVTNWNFADSASGVGY